MKLPAPIQRLLTFRMTARQYLVYQTLGSIFVNGLLNAGFALLKRSSYVIPLWGRQSIAADTLVTTFSLSSLTVLLGTFFIHRDYDAGRFEALDWDDESHPILKLFSHSTLQRVLAFGPLFTLLLVPPTLGVFAAAGIDELRYWPFFAFKTLYAVILGMIVTPLNALWVLTSPKLAARRRAEGH